VLARVKNTHFVLALLLLILLSAVASVTSAATYHGKVVDAETGKPLKGAVVAVIWHKKAILSMNGGWYFHNARETLTDTEGQFSLDASEGINWNPFTIVQEPRIIVFHPGYGPLSPGYPREFKDVYGIAEALERGALIKLPKLKTQEELRKFACSSCLELAADVPPEKVQDFIRLINVHIKMAGFKPYQ
jgi:hypothetical protein